MRARPLAGKAINTWSLKNNRKNEWRNGNYVSTQIHGDGTFTGPHSVTRKEACKSAQKGAACLAFSYIARATFSLAFTRYRMHILGTHVRHTPRAQSLLPARLPFPPYPSAHSITIGASPPSPARLVLSAFQPALHQFKVRALDPSPCFLSSFVLLSLSFLSRGFVYFAVLLE